MEIIYLILVIVLLILIYSKYSEIKFQRSFKSLKEKTSSKKSLKEKIIKQVKTSLYKEYDFGFAGKISWSDLLGSAFFKPNILMQEKKDSVDVTIFECFVAGKEGNRNIITVVLFESDQLNLPYFFLYPRFFYHKILSLMGNQNIKIGDFPKFSKNYVLNSGNEEKARNLFNSKVLSYFEKNYGWSVEGKGIMLLVTRRERVDPQNIKNFLQEADMIFRLFL
jgi:hypothetical protein